MNPTLTLDFRAWQTAAKELQKKSSLSVADFVNRELVFILQNAIKLTHKASRQVIERQMESTVISETPQGGRGAAKGWVRIKREVGRGSLAERILVAYHHKHGQWPVRGATHGERIKRLVAVKVKSAGMMRAGWVNALNDLRKASFNTPSGARNLTGFGKRNRLGGSAVPARTKLGLIEAVAMNEAPRYQQQHRQEKAWTGDLGNPMPVLEAGLGAALRAQAAKLVERLAAKLRKELARFGMK